MKIFQLSYVCDNNGETGVSHSIEIAQSTNEEVIMDILNKNHLNYTTSLDRGEDHIFVLTSWEPVIDPYFYQERLDTAIRIDTDYKVKLAEERYEWEQLQKKRAAENAESVLKDIAANKDARIEIEIPTAKGIVDEELIESTDDFAKIMELTNL